MQYRMKTYSLQSKQIETLLNRLYTATIATINADGTPYATPIHFIYKNHKIYFHGLPQGQKIDNMKANADVSFTAYEMRALLLGDDGKPCDTNTSYESVIIQGKAHIISEIAFKNEILSDLVKKYTPSLSYNKFPENMLKGTAVVEISIETISGKYYE